MSELDMMGPFYGCTNCCDNRTMDWQELSLYEGQTWCDECWEALDMERIAKTKFFNLSSFIPEQVKKIKDLELQLSLKEARLKNYEKIIKSLQGMVVDFDRQNMEEENKNLPAKIRALLSNETVS
ncbi:MAG: hypothetical protein OQJ80_05465 [Kangiella sp.]|nr:hypothetical protein [Kangiella sp.]